MSSAWNYLQLAEFCRAQGRADEALRRAEDGLWMFEDDRPDERLVFFAADLLSKAGRAEDAEKHLWRAFEKQPSLALFARLRQVGGDAARDRAIAVCEARLVGKSGAQWYDLPDLLIRMLMQAAMLDAAWAAVGKHGGSLRAKEALARSSEGTHPAEAIATYAERIEALARSGGNPAYAEAAALVSRVATLHGGDEQRTFVSQLRARHGRKRNLMKLLG